MEKRKVKCPKCGNMNEKEKSVLIGKRYFCPECVGADKIPTPVKEKAKEENDKDVQEKQKPKVVEYRKFEMHEEVPVISLVKRGKLIFVDHEGIEYEWSNFKDENYLTIKSLMHMRNRYKKFFLEPLVRVDDDVAHFLKIKIDDSIDLENIDQLFTLNNEDFEQKLLTASNGIRNIVIDAAINKIDNGELDSRQKVRIIEQICNVELEEKAYREFSKEIKKKW